MVLVLPFTFGMEPLNAMYVYAGIMGATTLGGAVTAILINTPGTPGNIVTTIEGYAMTKRGQATRALSISAFASSLGTFVGIAILILLLPFVEALIFNLRAPEIFWIIVIGIISIAFVARGNLLKGLVAALIGILLSLIGFSPIYGVRRFDLNAVYLWDGVELVAFFVGLFAISEILGRITQEGAIASVPVGKQWWKQTVEGARDVIRYPVTFFRSSIIGTIIGIIPGLGASVANAISYTTTVALAKGRRLFGSGEPEGLVACESANNAKDGGALLTTVAFGIPGSPEMAVLLGALMLHGLQPGLYLVTEHADVVWALIIGLFLSQFVTSAWTLGGARWFSRITTMRVEFVWLPVLLASFVGIYAVRENIWDTFMMVAVGFLAFGMRRFGFPIIAMAIGFILGVLAENALRQSLMISLGNVAILFTRPVPIAIIAVILLGAIILIWGTVSRRSQRRRPSSSSVKPPKSYPDSHRQSAGKLVNKGAFIFGLGLLLTVIAFLYSSLQFRPDVGIFPLITSATALILLVPIIVGELVPSIQQYFETGVEYLFGTSQETVQESAQREYQQKPSTKAATRMAALVIALLLAVYFLGFLIAVPLCFMVYLLAGRRMRWWTAVLFTAGAWAVLFLAFDQLMQLDLWRGSLPELIPNWLGGEIVPRLW